MKGTCGFCVLNWNPQSEKELFFMSHKRKPTTRQIEHENFTIFYYSHG